MRTRNVVHLHTVNRMQAFGWPLVIMTAALALVLAIGGLVGAVGGEPARDGMQYGMQWNGAIFALLGPLIGFGFMAMSQYFPLALGLGITRRDFAAGTGAVFLGNALLYATIVTIGKVIEVATGGFGLRIRFFDVVYTGLGPWWATFIQTFLLIIMIQLVGAAITTAFLRWGQPFLWWFWISGGVVALVVTGALLLSDPARQALAAMVGLGWWFGMLTTVLVAVLGGSVWLSLLRRAQA